MTASYINLTEGSGKKLRTDTRLIGSDTVHEETVLLGDQHQPAYIVTGWDCATTGLNDHLLQIMAGSSKRLYIRRIMIQQQSIEAAASQASLRLMRLTTAGTGGTADTVIAKLDPSDPANDFTSRRNLTASKGTEGQEIMTIIMPMGAANPLPHFQWQWDASADRGIKPVVIAAGTSNGVCIKNDVDTGTSGLLRVTVELTEQSF